MTMMYFITEEGKRDIEYAKKSGLYPFFDMMNNTFCIWDGDCGKGVDEDIQRLIDDGWTFERVDEDGNPAEYGDTRIFFRPEEW